MHKDVNLEELLLFRDSVIKVKDIESCNQKVINNKPIVMSEVFEIDDIFEIADIIKKYLSTNFVVNVNTPFELFKKFCESEGNEKLINFVEKGNKQIEEMRWGINWMYTFKCC